MNSFQAEIHRFDDQRLNWERTVLRVKEEGMNPLWRVFDYFTILSDGAPLAIFQMDQLHQAVLAAATYGKGTATVELRGRAYDVAFVKQ